MPEWNDPGDKDPFKTVLIYKRLSGIRGLNRDVGVGLHWIL
jgi:hypothetical protein